MGDASNTLDFVIIGAPKTGTTSLSEYLRSHSELHLPQWKETGFFLDPVYRRGVDWYLQWVRTGAPAGAICGEASVRYMAGTATTAVSDGDAEWEPTGRAGPPPERVVPTRIHSALPGVKLIALLRDPVERCISEHRMAVLVGDETRGLDAAVHDLLESSRLADARARFNPVTSYVVQGEYARILAPYYDLFGPDKLLILFTSDLANDPEGTVRRIWRYLGVDDTFVPPNLGVRYREGTERRKLRALDFPRLVTSSRRNLRLRAMWRRVPASMRQKVWTLSYKVDMWNRETVASAERPTVSPELELRLRQHYRADRDRLTCLLGGEPPWQ